MDKVLFVVVCCVLLFANVVVNEAKKKGGKPGGKPGGCKNENDGCCCCSPPVHSYTPATCADVYDTNPDSASGTYDMTYNGQTFEVYCDFYDGGGYTYIPESALGHLPPLSELSNDWSHFIIRLLDDKNHQYAVTVQQLSTYAFQYPLSFQLNMAIDYQAPQNLNLGPYLYAGTLPTEVTTLPSSPLTGVPPEQGYNAGGMDFTFTNCDQNGNAYFALLYNENNANPTRTGSCGGMICKFVDNVNEVPLSRYLPTSFFETLEVHYGGCGGFVLSSDIDNIEGASIGLPFVAEPEGCCKPRSIW